MADILQRVLTAAAKSADSGLRTTAQTLPAGSMATLIGSPGAVPARRRMTAPASPGDSRQRLASGTRAIIRAVPRVSSVVTTKTRIGAAEAAISGSARTSPWQGAHQAATNRMIALCGGWTSSG